jgi:NDP-sugar pyrophosphorylase family protein
MQVLKERSLTDIEVGLLIKNGCRSSDWGLVSVSGIFNADYIRNVGFYGNVLIGNIDGQPINGDDLSCLSVLENTELSNCIIGDGSHIRNVDHLSNTVIGKHCILDRIHELSASLYKPAFEINVRNENGKRKSLVFPGYFEQLQPLLENVEKFLLLEGIGTETKNFIGDGCILRNCGILNNIHLGPEASFISVVSSDSIWVDSKVDNPVVIEGSADLRKGIIAAGVSIGHSVQASDFYLGQNSNLLDGARVRHLILGANSTIAGAEVQNTLLFPFHQQHHSSSFLIAASIGGQSNLAAGTVLGSNHNSRSNDGELVAGRGFWPGLCTSVKHSSIFASFTLLAKGDYGREIFNPFPFSMIYKEEQSGQLVIYPAFWFIYNMYALERNWQKFNKRDGRIDKAITFHYHYLGPDTVCEMLEAIDRLQSVPAGNREFITIAGLEEGNREVLIKRPDKAIAMYSDMILYYAINTIITNKHIETEPMESSGVWKCMGGIPVPFGEWNNLKKGFIEGKPTVRDLRSRYLDFQKNLPVQETQFANDLISRLYNKNIIEMMTEERTRLLDQYKRINRWILSEVKKSREKDYLDPIRDLLFLSREEKEFIMGSCEKDPFIIEAEIRINEELKGVELWFESLNGPRKGYPFN